MYDPFPNAALEALASGLPAIVSASCGAAEIIQPGANGWICEATDTDDVLRALRMAVAGAREARMTLGARASAEAYGLDAMAQKLAALYASLLAT